MSIQTQVATDDTEYLELLTAPITPEAYINTNNIRAILATMIGTQLEANLNTETIDTSFHNYNPAYGIRITHMTTTSGNVDMQMHHITHLHHPFNWAIPPNINTSNLTHLQMGNRDIPLMRFCPFKTKSITLEMCSTPIANLEQLLLENDNLETLDMENARHLKINLLLSHPHLRTLTLAANDDQAWNSISTGLSVNTTLTALHISSHAGFPVHKFENNAINTTLTTLSINNCGIRASDVSAVCQYFPNVCWDICLEEEEDTVLFNEMIKRNNNICKSLDIENKSLPVIPNIKNCTAERVIIYTAPFYEPYLADAISNNEHMKTVIICHDDPYSVTPNDINIVRQLRAHAKEIHLRICFASPGLCAMEAHVSTISISNLLITKHTTNDLCRYLQQTQHRCIDVFTGVLVSRLDVDLTTQIGAAVLDAMNRNILLVCSLTDYSEWKNKKQLREINIRETRNKNNVLLASRSLAERCLPYIPYAKS